MGSFSSFSHLWLKKETNLKTTSEQVLMVQDVPVRRGNNTVTSAYYKKKATASSPDTPAPLKWHFRWQKEVGDVPWRPEAAKMGTDMLQRDISGVRPEPRGTAHEEERPSSAAEE